MTQSANHPESNDNAATSGGKPADKFREGPVHVSTWEKQGVNGSFRVASFELRYKKDKQWQTSHSYGASDLKFLENAAKEARHRIESWLRTTGARQGHTPAA
jgi:hypothetical protein